MLKPMKYLMLFLLFAFSTQASYAQHLDTREKKGKFALLAGNKRVSDYEYSHIFTDESNYAAAQNDHGWGLLNERGEVVLPFVYNQLVFAADNKMIAEKDGVFGVIDHAGKPTLPFHFEGIQQYYPGGTALVKKDGRWGVLAQGEMSYDLSKVVFRQPDVYPLFAGTNLDLPTEEERFQDSAARLIEYFTVNLARVAITDLKKIKGDAEVVFVITASGEVKSARIVKGIGGDVGRIVLDIVKNMPDWVAPPQANGEPVAMEYKMPVSLDFKASWAR